MCWTVYLTKMFQSELHQMTNVFNTSNIMDVSSFPQRSLCKRRALLKIQGKFIRSLEEKLECWLQFVTLFKQRTAAEHIQAQTSTGHSHDKSSNITEMANKTGPDKRE
jgi:hypothetical protein